MSHTTCAEVLSAGSGTTGETNAGDPSDVTNWRLEQTRFLLIAERVEGFFIERFTESGELLGETQHETMDEAMRYAYSEYDTISDWTLCPDGAAPLEYIRARSSRSVGAHPDIVGG